VNDVEDLNFREHLKQTGMYIIGRFNEYGYTMELDDLIAKMWELWKELLPNDYAYADEDRADINRVYNALKKDMEGNT